MGRQIRRAGKLGAPRLAYGGFAAVAANEIGAGDRQPLAAVEIRATAVTLDTGVTDQPYQRPNVFTSPNHNAPSSAPIGSLAIEAVLATAVCTSTSLSSGST